MSPQLLSPRRIKAIRIGKKTLRIPSSELERYLEREPTTDPEVVSLEERVETFRKANGKDPGPFVDTWRSGEIEDTPENAEIAIEALALRTALARQHVAAA